MFSIKIFLILLAFIGYSNILISQKIKFIGNIEYVYETLLPSGIYKESQKSNSYFNEKSYCSQVIQKVNNSDSLIENHVNRAMQTLKQNNVTLDSFEIGKQRRKIRAQLEERYKGIEFNIKRFIDYNQNILVTPEKIADTSYCITDTLKKIEWILLEDTMTIEGLLCQKARGLYFGNFYDVWFAPSIPFAAGPGKIYGLPGIIVLAVSEDKKRRYKMNKLEYPLVNTVELINCINGKAVSTNEFLQLQQKHKSEVQKKRVENDSNRQK